ncbi:hypothetical protein Pfo_003725 [Paulownia fortunei]|nr:hypothetical protein Pfo_003725 [Paulownia fortunei]
MVATTHSPPPSPFFAEIIKAGSNTSVLPLSPRAQTKSLAALLSIGVVSKHNGKDILEFSDTEIDKLAEPFKFALVGKFSTTSLIFKWSPEFEPNIESSIAPVWIQLPGLPIHLFDKRALRAFQNLGIKNGIGAGNGAGNVAEFGAGNGAGIGVGNGNGAANVAEIGAGNVAGMNAGNGAGMNAGKAELCAGNATENAELCAGTGMRTVTAELCAGTETRIGNTDGNAAGTAELCDGNFEMRAKMLLNCVLEMLK